MSFIEKTLVTASMLGLPAQNAFAHSAEAAHLGLTPEATAAYLLLRATQALLPAIGVGLFIVAVNKLASPAIQKVKSAATQRRISSSRKVPYN